MATPNPNVSGKFAVDDTAKAGSVVAVTDFDASSKQYEFTSESVRMVQSHVDSIGVRGSRTRVKDHVRIAREDVGGSVSMFPTPVELDEWLPRILGAAESTDVFDTSETLTAFQMLFERGARRFAYDDCYVSRAVFSGAPGSLIGMTLDVAGKAEVISSTTFPATIPAIDTGQPYVFSDLGTSGIALSADASAVECLGFTLTIDNMLDRRFTHSVTATQVFPTDRLVTLEMVFPYTTDEIDLLDQSVDGAAGYFIFTNGNRSLRFDFGNLKSPSESPITPNRGGERTFTVRMNAYKTGSTPEIKITNDSSG